MRKEDAKGGVTGASPALGWVDKAETGVVASTIRDGSRGRGEEVTWANLTGRSGPALPF